MRMIFEKNFALLFTIAVTTVIFPASARPKILCLHGGGGTGEGFRGSNGMSDLENELSEFEFVYANAAYDGGEGFLWISDPPGGKDEPTTDPNFADDSIAVLDSIIQNQGPFAGILGYSQGAAFVPVYLSRAPTGTFDFAVTFCGYPTETHLGILEVVERESPFGNIPSLVWMGENDDLIGNAFTLQMALFFNQPDIVSSSDGGHAVPDIPDSTFDQVTSIIRSYGQPSPPSTAIPTIVPTPTMTLAPTPAPTMFEAPTEKPDDPSTAIPTIIPAPIMTLAPTLTPTMFEAPTEKPDDPEKPNHGKCADSPLQIVLRKRKISCDWVKKNPVRRCKRRGVSSHCPITCDACKKFGCEDSDRRFKLGDRNRKCRYFKGDPEKCDDEGASETCRKTCRYCEVGKE